MLKVVETVEQARLILKGQVEKGLKVGFVPTMGALHAGHISLINKAKSENDFVVSSIFVNPAQFNDKSDLKNYPRTPEADRKMLSDAGCDLLFEPSESEIYPEKAEFIMDFGYLERIMEGQFRPGHFNGVAKVVNRLFEITSPHNAYFGEKDFQQLTIIKELVRRKNLNVNIVGCPTLREKEGLALSSRNIHLTSEEKKDSHIIFHTINSARSVIIKNGIEESKQILISAVEKSGLFKVQYLEFVDSKTLLPIEKIEYDKEQRICIAVLTSKTRLIDNAAI